MFGPFQRLQRRLPSLPGSSPSRFLRPTSTLRYTSHTLVRSTHLLCFVALLGWMSPFANADTGLVVSQSGKPELVLVLPESPLPPEQRAAELIADHLEAVTGAVFPVLTLNQHEEQKDLSGIRPAYIGIWERLQPLSSLLQTDLEEEQALEGMNPEGVIICIQPDQAVVAGADAAGLGHAAHRFLEQAGIRYLWPVFYSFEAI